jgi:hypothetical protein
MKYFVWHGKSANTRDEEAIVNSLSEVQSWIEDKLDTDNMVGVEIEEDE